MQPNHGIAPRRCLSVCHINSIPNEILGEVFDEVLFMYQMRDPGLVHSRKDILPPLTMSHVCKRWRDVSIHMMAQWTHLEMRTIRHPDIFRDLVSRSKSFTFSLRVNLPSLVPDMQSKTRQIEFRETFKILKKNFARLRALHVTANNATLFRIFNTFLNNATYPRLESLILHQVDPTTLRYTLGPMTFDPELFHELQLENITIDCTASCLSGLHTLRLINSSGAILDQTQLRHSTYPDIPPLPIITHLTDLTVDATNLIPLGPDITPSFATTSLRKLTLSRLSMPSREAVDPLARLFFMTHALHLQTLTLERFDLHAFTLFVRICTEGQKPLRFPAVQQLTLKEVETRFLDDRFLTAFPAVIELNLVSLWAPPMMELLKSHLNFPACKEVYIDNVRFLRTLLPPPPAVPPPIPPAGPPTS